MHQADQTIKQDTGKWRPTLVPVAIIRAIAKVRAYGNTKYADPDSWKQVDPARYKDAFMRHVYAWLDDDLIDSESGLQHLWHAACNLAFLIDMYDTPHRIYIAGPMTGLPNYNRDAFWEMAEQLTDLGFEPVHTADLPDGWAWERYMGYSLSKLETCDAVILLDGWQESRGVAIEIKRAKELDMPIYTTVERLVTDGRND